MNKQTELEKAIERAKNHIHNNDTSQSLRDLELIVEAAEQLSALEAKLAAVERERDVANKALEAACQCAEQFKAELDQLLTDMKVVVPAMEQLLSHMTSGFNCRLGSYEDVRNQAHNALSTPSAKRILESEQNKEKETK